MQLSLTDWIALLVPAGGCLVWIIRLEGKQRQADRAIEKTNDDMQRYYATKQEVTKLEGAVNAIAMSGVRTEAAIGRIENKVDSFLVAAVQQNVQLQQQVNKGH